MCCIKTIFCRQLFICRPPCSGTSEALHLSILHNNSETDVETVDVVYGAVHHLIFLLCLWTTHVKFQSKAVTLCRGIFLLVSHVAVPRENMKLEIPRTEQKTARKTELDLLVPAELLQFVLRFLYQMGVILLFVL